MCGKRQTVKRRKQRRRPRAQGTITKLEGRRNPYWARLPVDHSTGIPVRESLGCFPTYTAAAEAIAKSLYVPGQRQVKKKTVTLQEIYDHFLNSHYYMGLTKGSQCAYRTSWKHFEKCAHVPVTEINRDTFQIPIDVLYKEGAKRETLAKIRNTASLLCREAMGLNLIHVNFGRLVQLPRADTEPAKPFSTEQIERIWDVSDYDKDAMAALMLIYTGMRPGELLSTDIAQHLHTDGEYWYIQHGSKTTAGRNRIIPLPKILHPIVLKLKENRAAGPLVPQNKAVLGG